MSTRTTILIVSLATVFQVAAQNPLFKDADPTARVFNDRIFVYTTSESGNNHWNIHSSDDLKTWKHHGYAMHLKDIPWRTMDADKQWGCWAPDCIERDGKYYFYGPVLNTNEQIYPRNSPIVLVAKNPEGPYHAPLEGPIIQKFHDPNVFIDRDGQAYLYSRQKVALLETDMITVKETKEIVLNFTPPEKWEATFMFERNGIYYFTFAESFNHLVYATGPGPMGPFDYKGEIMEPQKGNNHHSFVLYNGRWILFYHLRNNGIERVNHRMVWADYVTFTSSGEIVPLKPTKVGVHYSGSLKASIEISERKKRSIKVKSTITGGHQGEGIGKEIRWDFGDGQTGNGVEATHEYSRKGEYTISLQVIDGEQQVSTQMKIVVR